MRCPQRRTRRRHRPRNWWFVIGVTTCAVLAGVPAAGDPADDKAHVDQQLAQVSATYEAATQRARDAAIAYTAAATQLPGAQRSLAVARGRSAAATVIANRARREAAAASRVLAAATSAYQQSQRRVAETRDQVGTFVAAANRGSGAVAFSALFTASSPTDFVSRIAYLDQSAAALRHSLRQVTIARQDARATQNAATAAQRTADAKRADAENLLTAARTAENRAVTAAGAVDDLIAKRQQALAIAQDEEAETEQRYRELQAESARIAAVLRRLAARDSSPPRAAAKGQRSGGSAVFLMPTTGHKSSDFGMRYHPISHRWRLHSGLDIAAPGGSAILAADDGVVARAGRNGGYGNYTCIYHGRYQGDALSTCYAHQSRILVTRGQRVHRGQLIGRVGTTGSSTGNHLHFEVRRDGEPVNPLPFLG